MMKTFNQRLQEAARKRRAHLLKQHRKGKSIAELARKAKVTYERMRWMIRTAEGEE
jgi:molybdenum-dependent DNA-binding transcriptional regulator ModE